MTDSKKRDNEYWLKRFERDGRDDLLKMISDGDISVYRASMAAGLRKKRAAASRADQIAYHYARATHAEKRRFIIDNFASVARIVQDIAKKQRARDAAQKPSE